MIYTMLGCFRGNVAKFILGEFFLVPLALLSEEGSAKGLRGVVPIPDLVSAILTYEWPTHGNMACQTWGKGFAKRGHHCTAHWSVLIMFLFHVSISLVLQTCSSSTKCFDTSPHFESFA